MSSNMVPKSGKSPDQRSNFAQTCNLLSQYVKERRSFGHDHIPLGKIAPKGSPVTLNLLSSMENSAEDTTVSSSTKPASVEPEIASMTIFYGGKVFVFNDFPADKAREVLELAAKGSRSSTIPGSDSTTNIVKPNDVSNVVMSKLEPDLTTTTTTRRDFSQPPKSSLHRFFEKRKERIAARAPYVLPPSNEQKQQSMD